MYHHRMLWCSTMSNSNLFWKGLLFGGSTCVTTTPSFLRCCRVVVSTNINRWISSSSSSSSEGGMIRGFPRIPWLFLSPTSNGRILPVFNPYGRCYYDIPIPKEVQGPHNSVRGSGHGWLVMAKDQPTGTEMIISLYNPISRAHIPLPSLPENDLGNIQVWGNPTKASPGQPLVSIIFGSSINQPLLVTYRQGDDDWSADIMIPRGDYIGSTVYHEGDAALYVVYVDGRLSVLDVASSSSLRPLINTPSPEIQSLRGSAHIVSLVVSAAGDLLLVMKNWTSGDYPQYPGTYKFTRPLHFILFKLDKKCLEWVPTESDHNTLFMYKTDNCDHNTLSVYKNDNRIVSMVCDPSFTDAQPNQIYIFKQHRTRTLEEFNPASIDSTTKMEISGDVKVCDLIPAAGAPKSAEKERPVIFETSKVLRRLKLCGYRYLHFATWMVPSLT